METILKQRLLKVLASYGADPSRWPAADRVKLLPHLETAAAELDAARHIDSLLNLLAPPPLPTGFEGRLMARAAKGNPVPIHPVPKRRLPLGWATALPLAASLMLGIYLGARGSLDALLPATITGDWAASDDDDGDISGVIEATDFSEDQVS